MISLKDCISDLTTYFDIMIYNADVYCFDNIYRVVSRTPAEGKAFAAVNIGNILQAALKCIVNIDKQ